jgi:2-polyprenyl-3-methyl-5-hydroxy-6-metoxy-1,4-benzoquinol methylase
MLRRAGDTRVRNDAGDFYGRDYWFNHQTQKLGCPDIVSRSRSDLSERCVHWLRSLLEFKLPPAKALEVGCAHGGFVAMLRQAGFGATGLELSPSIVRFARQTFDVPVLTGPVEDQAITPASLDAVVLMDVMEHLPDPLQTLRHCLDLLKPDGVLFIQTPEYPAGRGLGDLRATAHKYPMMLDPDEHLFLFSKASTAKLFGQLDAPHLEFVPAIFGFYDMSFAVSRQPIQRTTASEREAALGATINGRFMQAMLDLDERRLSLLRKYRKLRAEAPPAPLSAERSYEHLVPA